MLVCVGDKFKTSYNLIHKFRFSKTACVWVTVSVLASLDRVPVVSIKYYEICVHCFPLSTQHLGTRTKTGCLEIRIRHAYQQTGGAVS